MQILILAYLYTNTLCIDEKSNADPVFNDRQYAANYHAKGNRLPSER